MDKISTLYNPAEKDKSSLIDEFVVRGKTFQRIFNDLKSSKMDKPEQQYLVIGQRGAGKTTLLHRLNYAVQDDAALSKWLIPIVFHEEQYHISELSNVWETIAEYLEDLYAFDGITGSIEEHVHRENYEEVAFKILIDEVKKRNKKLILFVDNFGVLLKKFSEIEVKRVREVLMTCADIRIVAASPILLEDVIDYKKPLFAFFKQVSLEGLNDAEIKTLLFKLGDIHNEKAVIEKIVTQHPERIETLRRLTGGVIRTVVLLFQIFIDNEDGKSITDLQLTLDAVTPLYKHRMDDLSKYQQKIVDAVAKKWDAISTKEISEITRLESKAVSSQLNQLVRNQIVEKETTSTKNNLYRIKERFFNIWYLMRYGKKHDRRRVIWLVKFLEDWCDTTEMEYRINRHLENLAKGHYNTNAAVLMGQAYVACSNVPSKLKYELANNTRELVSPKQMDGLDLSDSELYESAVEYLNSGNNQSGLEALGSIKNKNSSVLMMMGETANQLKDFEKAKKYLKKAIELGLEKEDLTRSLYNLGVIYDDADDDKASAKGFYQRAFDLGDALSAHFLAHIYESEGDFEKAEKFYSGAFDNGNENAGYCLANMYENQLRFKDAEEWYDKIFSVTKDIKARARKVRVYAKQENYELAERMFNDLLAEGCDEVLVDLGIISVNYYEDFKKAEDFFRRARKKGIDFSSYYLAKSLADQDEPEKAEKYYLESVEQGDKHSIHELAHIYSGSPFNDFKKSEKYFNMAIEKGLNVQNCLAEMYFQSKDKKKKERALELSSVGVEMKEFSPARTISHAIMLLWNNRIDESIENFIEAVNGEEELEELMEDMTSFLILLISKGQYHSTYELLTVKIPELKDMLKPVYYALMYFMTTEHPTEFLKMGFELKETVDEIVETIVEYKEGYT